MKHPVPLDTASPAFDRAKIKTIANATHSRRREMMKPGPVTIIKVEPGMMVVEAKTPVIEPMSKPGVLGGPVPAPDMIARTCAATVGSTDYADAINVMSASERTPEVREAA